MAILSSLAAGAGNMLSAVADSITAPSGLWEWLILKVFSFIADYGWRIIVFIILLKLLLSPLDIFQRIKMRKNTRIAEDLKPELEKLKKQYGGDSKVLSQKQMELNRKSGYSYFSSCIPMIVTMVIFFTLFAGMRSISQYMIFKQYAHWYDTYKIASTVYETEHMTEAEQDDLKSLRIELSGDGITEGLEAKVDRLQKELDETQEGTPEYAAIKAELDAVKLRRAAVIGEIRTYETKIKSFAQDAVVAYNDENAESFLWIKSIWQPDVTWKKPIHENKDAFVTDTANYSSLTKNKGKLDEAELSIMLESYSDVTEKLVASPDNKQNGLFILVVLAVGLNALSQVLTQKLQKKSGQLEANGGTGGMGGMMKIMLFIMPVMMGIFALSYTAAFAIYMVTNSFMSVLISTTTTVVINIVDKNKKTKASAVVASYGRPDPNAEGGRKRKGKIKKDNETGVVKYGRPDPNDPKNSKK